MGSLEETYNTQHLHYILLWLHNVASFDDQSRHIVIQSLRAVIDHSKNRFFSFSTNCSYERKPENLTVRKIKLQVNFYVSNKQVPILENEHSFTFHSCNDSLLPSSISDVVSYHYSSPRYHTSTVFYFQIVPLESKYKRGRWNCFDYYDKDATTTPKTRVPEAVTPRPTSSSRGSIQIFDPSHNYVPPYSVGNLGTLDWNV